jgi:hypothetical protein
VNDVHNEPGPNGVLLEGFRHNAWATKQLLAFCKRLSIEQLAIPATGAYGGILATFNHLILSEAGYLRAPFDKLPAWAANDEHTGDLDELASRVEETARPPDNVKVSFAPDRRFVKNTTKQGPRFSGIGESCCHELLAGAECRKFQSGSRQLSEFPSRLKQRPSPHSQGENASQQGH